MDFIGTVSVPQDVDRWLPLVLVVLGLVIIILAVVVAYMVYVHYKGDYDRTGNTISAFFAVIVGGIFVSMIVGLAVADADEERVAHATVLKIESTFDFEVLDYERGNSDVTEFTAIDSDGMAVIGRTSYEGELIYLTALSTE